MVLVKILPDFYFSLQKRSEKCVGESVCSYTISTLDLTGSNRFMCGLSFKWLLHIKLTDYLIYYTDFTIFAAKPIQHIL